MSDLKNKTKDQLIVEVKKLRKELANSLSQEEKLKIDFMDNVNDLIQTVDLDGKFMYVNKKWMQTLEYSESEVKKLRITDVLRKDQSDKVTNLLQAVANGGKVDTIKLVFITKSGKEIYVEGNGNGVFVDGKFSGAIGIFRDVTKCELLDQSLTSERNKAQHYLNIAGVIMLALDSAGNITLVNKKACEILGYSRDEIIGKNWFDNFLQKENVAIVKEVFNKAMKGQIEQIEFFENKVITKTGKIKDIRWHNSLIKDSKGNIVGGLSSGQDITEWKLAEAELVESHHRYYSIFEHSPIPIWEEDFSDVKSYFNNLSKKDINDIRAYFDKNPNEVLNCSSLVKITDVNETSLTFFDVKTKKELIKKLPEYFNKDSLTVFKEELISLASGKDAFESEIPIIDIKGNLRILILKLNICPGHEKTWSKVYVSFIDITERKESELQIKQQTEDLKLINKINESARVETNLKELIYIFSNETRKTFDCMGATAYLFDSKKENLVLQNITLSLSLQESIKKYIGIKIPEVIIPFVPGSFYFEALKNISPKLFNETTIAQKLIEANAQTTSIKNKIIRKTILKVALALQKLLKIKSYIMVPLIANNELIGFAGFSGTNIFSNTDLKRISHIVSSFNTIINKKIIDEALKKSEANLKAVIENREESIWSIDKDYNYLTFNKYYYEAYLITYNVKLHKGINALEILTPKLRKLWKGKYDLALKGTRTNFELSEFIFEDQHYFDVSLNPIFTGDKITGVSALSINITEKKKVQTELLEAELQFRTIFEQAHDSIVLMDAETNTFAEFNGVSYERLGYTRDEFLKLKLSDLEAKENLAETEKHLKKIMKDGTDIFESKYRKKNGKIIDIIISAKKLILRNKVYVLGMWKDISEQKRATKKIKESEEKFRLLAYHSFEWEYWIDSKGNYIFISESCERISGITTEQYAANPQLFLDIIHTDFKNEVTKHFQDEFRENSKYCSMQFKIVTSIGEERWIEHNCNPVFDSKGVYHGRRGVNRDITERKTAEQELKNSNKKLVDLTMHIEKVRENERSKIALDLHDDLGQKLTALNMDLVWLEKNIDKKDKKIQNKFISMSDLLNDTLKSVKTISTELRPSILDDLGLNAALEWLLSEFQKNTDIRCHSNLSSDEFSLDPDLSIMVFRMIQESLTNISRHANAKEVNVLIAENNDDLKISIKDNGIGISKQEIENPDSFGLRGISERAKSCGGNVQIISKPNKGTEIIINLPLNIKR